jgi:hypothetical protein
MAVNVFPQTSTTLEPGTSQLVFSKKISLNNNLVSLTNTVPADSYIVTIKSDVSQTVAPSYTNFTNTTMFTPNYVNITSPVSSIELRTPIPFTQVGTSIDTASTNNGTFNMVYLNGYFIAFRAGGSGILFKKESELLSFTNPQLDSWTQLTTGLPGNAATGYAVNETNNTILYVTGTSGASGYGLITVGTDSVTAAVLTAPVANTVAAAYGNGIFMIVASDRTCYTSPTGTTWTLRNSNVTSGATNLTELVYGGPTIGWLAATTPTTSVVYRSTFASGGVAWTQVHTAASGTLYNDPFVSGNTVILNTKDNNNDVAVYTTDGTTYTAITAKPASIGDFSTVNGYVFFTITTTGETFRASSDFLTLTLLQTFTPQSSADVAGSTAFCSNTGTFVYISYDSTADGTTTTVAKLIENDCLVQFYRPALTE